MTPEKNHDLTLDEVIPRLHAEVADIRANPKTDELTDISADTAFVLGYETAVHDLVRFTGPDPVETGVIIYTNTGETDDDA